MPTKIQAGQLPSSESACGTGSSQGRRQIDQRDRGVLRKATFMLEETLRFAPQRCLEARPFVSKSLTILGQTAHINIRRNRAWSTPFINVLGIANHPHGYLTWSPSARHLWR